MRLSESLAEVTPYKHSYFKLKKKSRPRATDGGMPGNRHGRAARSAGKQVQWPVAVSHTQTLSVLPLAKYFWNMSCFQTYTHFSSQEPASAGEWLGILQHLYLEALHGGAKRRHAKSSCEKSASVRIVTTKSHLFCARVLHRRLTHLH